MIYLARFKGDTMKLSEYFKKMPRGYRFQLAAMVKCHPTYISHISRGYRTASPKMAMDIELATNGEVTRYDLRDDAEEIWGASS